jgi:hypothetical protein
MARNGESKKVIAAKLILSTISVQWGMTIPFRLICGLYACSLLSFCTQTGVRLDGYFFKTIQEIVIL